MVNRKSLLRIGHCDEKLCGLNKQQEAQLSPSDRAMRLVSSNLANCQATVQKLLIGPTTSPDQTDGMKLEVYLELEAMCSLINMCTQP